MKCLERDHKISEPDHKLYDELLVFVFISFAATTALAAS